mgnify:CR=1 FL=1
MSKTKIPTGSTFDPNRVQYCITVMSDEAAKTGCNLLELQHALKSMKAVVDSELEVRLGNARNGGKPRRG